MALSDLFFSNSKAKPAQSHDSLSDTERMPEDCVSVLLVEDNLSDAKLLTKLLAKASLEDEFKVIHVIRLSDALVELGSKKFDAILLDLSLPDSSGLNSIESVKSH